MIDHQLELLLIYWRLSDHSWQHEFFIFYLTVPAARLLNNHEIE